MKRELIKKNAKFNSKTSNAVIRVKEVDGDMAIVETVRHIQTDSYSRYLPIAKSERVIDVASIQKAYYCGKDSTRQARVQKGQVYTRPTGDLIRVVRVSGDKVDVESVYQRAGQFQPIAGSVRTNNINSLLKNYKEVK